MQVALVPIEERLFNFGSHASIHADAAAAPKMRCAIPNLCHLTYWPMYIILRLAKYGRFFHE